MSDTPRTDCYAKIENILGLENIGLVPADFARSLEREVNRLRKERGDALLAYKILDESYKLLRQEIAKLKRDKAVMNYNLLQRAGIDCELDLENNEIIYKDQ
jgi:hypothetical protein